MICAIVLNFLCILFSAFVMIFFPALIKNLLLYQPVGLIEETRFHTGIADIYFLSVKLNSRVDFRHPGFNPEK